MDLKDRSQICVDMAAGLGAAVDGVATCMLHIDERETVTYHVVAAGARCAMRDVDARPSHPPQYHTMGVFLLSFASPLSHLTPTPL